MQKFWKRIIREVPFPFVFGGVSVDRDQVRVRENILIF